MLPVNPGSSEEPTTRVRPKAPRAASPGEQRQGEHRDTPADQARSLVARLITLAPSEIAPVIRRLLPLGNFALEELAGCFPEPLWLHGPEAESRLLHPEEISASAAALAAFEEEAVPYLARLMRHPRSIVRYYATVICAAYSNVSLLEPLAHAALDEDGECRRVAIHLLSRYRDESGYRWAIGALRARAADVTQPAALRRRAIAALTRLRDDPSAGLFIDLLADHDLGIATASRVGLRVLTAHDFGFSRKPWLRWHAERGRDDRLEWLIEGLGDGRPSIRALASRELWTATRLLEPLSEADDREEFLDAQRRYERWRTKAPRA